jgi:hypothetical protein
MRPLRRLERSGSNNIAQQHHTLRCTAAKAYELKLSVYHPGVFTKLNKMAGGSELVACHYMYVCSRRTCSGKQHARKPLPTT